MRLIDADRLLEERRKRTYYHLPNGDTAIPIIDIEHAPTITAEPHWIPVTERLPETNEDVLLQFKSSMGVGFWEYGDWAINTGDGIYSLVGYNEEKPIAWMSLPAPYQPQRDVTE